MEDFFIDYTSIIIDNLTHILEKNKHLNILKLKNIGLSDGDIINLLKRLQFYNLEELDISNNENITNVAGTAIVKALEKNIKDNKLTDINISGTKISEKIKQEMAKYFVITTKKIPQQKIPQQKSTKERHKSPTSVKDRILLEEAINNGYININKCHINDLFKHISKIIFPSGIPLKLNESESKTESEAIIIIGELNWEYIAKKPELEKIKKYFTNEWLKENLPKEVVLKVTPTIIEPEEDNALLVEKFIYEKFISKIVVMHVTPHVIFPFATYTCEKWANFFGNDEKLRYLRLDFGEYDWDKLNIIMIEKSQGVTLREWLTIRRPTEYYYIILFQIFYTLECFAEIGIRHNDLHFDNIWIEQYDKKQKYAYFLAKNLYIIVETEDCVKFFDLDRSAVYSPLVLDKKLCKLITSKKEREEFLCPFENTTLEMLYCRHFGTCNSKNEKFDPFSIIHQILYRTDIIVPQEIKDWLLHTFFASIQKGKELLEEPRAVKHLLCKLDDKKKCQGDYEPGDDIMRSTQYVLTHGFDKRFNNEKFNNIHKYNVYSSQYDPFTKNDFENYYMLPHFWNQLESKQKTFESYILSKDAPLKMRKDAKVLMHELMNNLK